MIIDKRKLSLYSRYELGDLVNPIDASETPKGYNKVEGILRLVDALANPEYNNTVIIRDGKPIRYEDTFNAVEITYTVIDIYLDEKYVTSEEFEVLSDNTPRDFKSDIKVYTETIPNAAKFLKEVEKQSKKKNFYEVGRYLKEKGYIKHVPTRILWMIESLPLPNGERHGVFTDVNKSEIESLTNIIYNMRDTNVFKNTIKISWEIEEHMILDGDGRLTMDHFGNHFFEKHAVSKVAWSEKEKGWKALKVWFILKWLNFKIWVYYRYLDWKYF